jgi:hypothetical protein
VVESKIENLDASVRKWSGDQAFEEEDSDREIDYDNPKFTHLKVTESLKKYVKHLTTNPSGFTEHPEARRQDGQKLSWEEQRHAMTILEAVPEFSTFRYELTPSQISEISFWKIYFSLIRQHHLGFESEDHIMESAHPSAEELVPEHRSPQIKFKISKNDIISDSEDGFLEIKKPYVGKLDEEDESYYSDFSIVGAFSKKAVTA